MKKLNIGIVAHVDAGKTTVTENILQLCGIIAHAGRVDHGDTLTDSMELEKIKGISIKATPVSFQYNDVKINLIDTPGHVDFISEVERSLGILDGVVLIISAKEGIQSQTKVLIKAIKDLKIPCIIFINKIDRSGVELDSILNEVKKSFMGKIINMQIAANDQTEDIKLLSRSSKELLDDAIDLLSNLDEEILIHYVNSQPLPMNALYEKLQYYTKQAGIYPVFMGCALKGCGIKELLDAIISYLPLAVENDDAPLSALVFKIDNQSKERKIYARIFQGMIKIRETITFHSKTEKVKSLMTLENGKAVRKEYVGSGDICILSIKDLKVSDIIGEPIDTIKKVSIASPALRVQIVPKNPADKRKLYESLLSLAEEDPMMSFTKDQKNDKLYVNLFGEVQMEIIRLLLNTEYDIDIEFSNLSTIYKETPIKKGCAVTYMGSNRNHYRAGIGIEVEPLPRGTGLQYESKVSFGLLEKSFQNAVEEAVWENCKNGIYGLEITDAKVTFVFSQYDSVTSTPSDYRDLTPLVLMEAFINSGMQLLEPILEFELIIPEHMAGKALYDCNKMNAEIKETNSRNEEFIITGFIPVETSKDYKIHLASYSEGQGAFITKFLGYRETELDEVKFNLENINPATNRELYLLQKVSRMKS